MATRTLSQSERRVLRGLLQHPRYTDRELADELGLKQSTVSTIRRRLLERGCVRPLRLPAIQRLGCELFVLNYTAFNPALTAQERTERSRQVLEVAEEIVLSIGETHMGFSLGFSQNYTSVAKINDRRIATFASMGIIENNFPQEAFFPFAISTFHRFFDFSGLVGEGEDEPGRAYPHRAVERVPLGDLERKHWGPGQIREFFADARRSDLSPTERLVLYALVAHPHLSDRRIAQILPYSRHTVSGLRRKFEEDGLLLDVYLPDLSKLGLRIIELLHARAQPAKPFDDAALEEIFLPDGATFLLVSRPFELLALLAYASYEEARVRVASHVRELKERGYLFLIPTHHSYTIENMITVKEVKFAPIVGKILGIPKEGQVLTPPPGE